MALRTLNTLPLINPSRANKAGSIFCIRFFCDGKAFVYNSEKVFTSNVFISVTTSVAVTAGVILSGTPRTYLYPLKSLSSLLFRYSSLSLICVGSLCVSCIFITGSAIANSESKSPLLRRVPIVPKALIADATLLESLVSIDILDSFVSFNVLNVVFLSS